MPHWEVLIGAAYGGFIDQAAVFAEPGNVHTGAQQIAEAHPTVGYKMVIEHDSPKVTSFGQTAVAFYRQSEKEIYGEQSLTSRWTVVDTYIKKDGGWVLVAHAQVPELLKRQPVNVNPAVFSQYVGQYEWGPGFVDTVSAVGGKLVSQLTNEDKPDELQPLNETTFFVDGDDDEGLIIFEKGESGKVSRYVYREKSGDHREENRIGAQPQNSLSSKATESSGAGLGHLNTGPLEC